AVLDHDRLAPFGLQLVADDARQHVVDAAARERHHELDRMVRKAALGRCGYRSDHEAEQDKTAGGADHGGPGSVRSASIRRRGRHAVWAFFDPLAPLRPSRELTGFAAMKFTPLLAAVLLAFPLPAAAQAPDRLDAILKRGSLRVGTTFDTP